MTRSIASMRPRTRRWWVLAVVAGGLLSFDAGAATREAQRVDPRFPYTLELAPLAGMPLLGTFVGTDGRQYLSQGALVGARLAGFLPVAEGLQAGVGAQAVWLPIAAGYWIDVTTLVGGLRWLRIDEPFRTMTDVQVAVDVGRAFAIGVRAAASLAYALPVEGLAVQGTLAGEVMAVQARAALTLSAGLSYSW